MSDQNAALFDKLDGFYVTKSEHDWLERRFSNMTEKEKILFQGAMELEKPQEIGHVMRIASQLDCYDLFYGAGDEAALGKFVMESIECSSDAARPFLNAEHLGAAYHQSQNAQRVKQLSADEIYRHSAETAAKESLLSALIHDSYELDDDDLDLILKPKNPVEALYQFLTSDKTDLSSESSISSILSEYNAQCQERDLTLGEEVTMC